ncbi:MAG TPA: hypothetical protein DIW20_00155, partial [Rhodospirillaceae bacterium]|nr:hypothetical protein [Rhodospirillaceae bacterium]
SVDYLRLCSLVVLGHMWLKMAAAAKIRLADNAPGRAFYETKLQSAAFYYSRLMPQTLALAETLRAGADVLMAPAAEAFTRSQTNIAEATRPLPTPTQTETGEKKAS